MKSDFVGREIEPSAEFLRVREVESPERAESTWDRLWGNNMQSDASGAFHAEIVGATFFDGGWHLTVRDPFGNVSAFPLAPTLHIVSAKKEGK